MINTYTLIETMVDIKDNLGKIFKKIRKNASEIDAEKKIFNLIIILI